ncbi:hypothetical protein LLEC1_06985 [Akanthomyces lecanii]|uniref:Secreted protein n=1 Tax=Cordyceps confragosa TaxID=2714763 RepID=A0A179I504_CORDF|nr:hypothetical protein LLEC1_06985 [Akanthomyces lecanii]
MGALVALAILALCGLGGYRVHRRNRNGASVRGVEKRPDDRDLQYGTGGDAQERIGSWEMRGQPKGQSQQTHVHQTADPFDDDAGSDVGGAAPVRARDSF